MEFDNSRNRRVSHLRRSAWLMIHDPALTRGATLVPALRVRRPFAPGCAAVVTGGGAKIVSLEEAAPG